MTPVSVKRVDEDDRRGGRAVPAGVVVGLVLALVAVTAVAIWLVRARNSAQDELEETEAAYAAGPEAQAAAEQILGEIISFDHRDLDGEYDWTRYFANADLRADYENDIAPKFRKVILRTEATAQGDIEQSAYNILDDDRVNVLAFVRQRLTDVDNKRGVIAEQWASLTMVRDGDDWLIDEIDIVSVPPPS